MALEDDSNVTHYACADITFVEESVFKTSTYALSCFNATDDSYYSVSDYGAEDPTTQSSSAASTASSTSSSSSRGEGASLQIAGVAGVGAAIMALNYLI
ncbi:unnamed protein product [[Candida] boidinii]|nr:unnamed protein product [[Candida] boidinii]GMG30229.1 unnamed protein product [[Candida] boidinii]